MRVPKPPHKQPRRATGDPPKKDRAGHDAARGVPIPKLADLSRETLSEDEILNWKELITKESDRGAAIMAGALVEQALTKVIRSHLTDPGDKITKTWFEGQGAPFGTFAAKITLGRALGIYSDYTERRLIFIKDVRNAFAHSVRPLDFKHATLAAACHQKLPPPNVNTKDIIPTQALFYAHCHALAGILTKDDLIVPFLINGTAPAREVLNRRTGLTKAQ